MSSFTCLGVGLAVALLAVCSGCVPAHIAWSPDGARAAYFKPGSPLGLGYVLDGDGKVTAELGQMFGSFAWSKDSQSVYFGALDPRPPVTDGAIRQWVVDHKPAPAQEPVDGKPGLPDKEEPMTLSRWRAGKVEALASIGYRRVLYVQLSPDEKWVAVMTSKKGFGEPELFVFSIGSEKLYAISETCGWGVCFTGTGQLVYTQIDFPIDPSSARSKVIEVMLDESAKELKRVVLVDALNSFALSIQSTEEGLLFTAAFPLVGPKPARSEDQRIGLYYFSRANGRITTLAEATASWYPAVSPDGKRILYFKGTDALCVINAKGGDEQVLRHLDGYEIHLMRPAWRGNDEITFVATVGEHLPVKPGGQPHSAFDLLQYKITAQGAIEPGRLLSESWPVEMKPTVAERTSTTAPKAEP